LVCSDFFDARAGRDFCFEGVFAFACSLPPNAEASFFKIFNLFSFPVAARQKEWMHLSYAKRVESVGIRRVASILPLGCRGTI
jgi:hypothetical protein